MSAPRSCATRMLLAAFLVAGLAATGLRAEDKPTSVPQATVPLPPPEPPPRPEELKQDAAAPATPASPQPPPRPPELSGAAAPAAPLPPERPPELKGESATLPQAGAPTLDAPAVPPRAQELSGSQPLMLTIQPMPLPPERPPELSTKALEQAALAVPEDTACLRSLDTLGVKYRKLPPIVNGQCTVAHPLDLEAIGDGVSMNSIAITADQMIVCSVAEALGRWAKDAEAAAEKELGDKLKGLALGGGYHCRGQNNVTEAKLSEHAFANAMDIMGFTFAKHAPIAVSFLPEGSPEAKFVDSVRASACKHFRTVLGPGSNEAHANHLHFDQRQREGGHRICELREPGKPASAQSAEAKR